MEARALTCSSCGAPVPPDALACVHCGAQVSTVACPGCFARVPVSAAFCPRCGGRLAMGPREGPALPCPECRIPLVTTSVGAVGLDQCGRCGGLWLSRAVFEEIVRDRALQMDVLAGGGAGRTVRPAPEAVRYRPCAACGRPMNRVNFGRVSGVVLDVCRDDGLWFDQDELHRVVGFLQSGGLERGQRREHEARKAELERLRDSARDAALQAPSGWDARTGTLDLGRFLSSVLDLLDR